jgi:hypothetical protein
MSHLCNKTLNRCIAANCCFAWNRSLRTAEVSCPDIAQFRFFFRYESEFPLLVTSVGDTSGRRDGLTTYD